MIKATHVAVRAVAKILVRGNTKIRGWGQARPERPRARVEFLGRGYSGSHSPLH